MTDACVIDDRAFFAGWRADNNTLVQTASLSAGAADTGFVQGYRHADYLVRSVRKGRQSRTRPTLATS